MLIRTQLRRPESIVKVPVAWIDSDALSTTTDLQPYLPMLQKIVAMYRAYLRPNDESDTFAAFIDLLDEEAWGRLLDNIPAGITSREPSEFQDYSGVSAQDLSRAST